VIIANYNDMPNYDVLVSRKEADGRGSATSRGCMAAAATAPF
jgi:hypothetical protein